MIEWKIKTFDVLDDLENFLNSGSEEYTGEPVSSEKVKALFQDKNTGKYVLVLTRDPFYTNLNYSEE